MPSLEQINKLLAAEPNDVFLNYSLAMQLAKESRGDEAVRQFERVIQLDPNYCAAYHHQAATLIGAGRLDDARQSLRNGIAAAARVGNPHAQGEMQELLHNLG